jgi:hypothetical protein
MPTKKRRAAGKKRKSLAKGVTRRVKALVRKGVATLKDEDIRTMQISVAGGGFGRLGGKRGDLSRVDADPRDHEHFDKD